MRKMIVVLVGIAGCGAFGPAPDRLPAACWWLDDDGIETRRILTEIARDEGASQPETTAWWLQQCRADEAAYGITDPAWMEDCSGCFVRLTESVFNGKSAARQLSICNMPRWSVDVELCFPEEVPDGHNDPIPTHLLWCWPECSGSN